MSDSSVGFKLTPTIIAAGVAALIVVGVTGAGYYKESVVKSSVNKWIVDTKNEGKVSFGSIGASILSDKISINDIVINNNDRVVTIDAIVFDGLNLPAEGESNENVKLFSSGEVSMFVDTARIDRKTFDTLTTTRHSDMASRTADTLGLDEDVEVSMRYGYEMNGNELTNVAFIDMTDVGTLTVEMSVATLDGVDLDKGLTVSAIESGSEALLNNVGLKSFSMTYEDDGLYDAYIESMAKVRNVSEDVFISDLVTSLTNASNGSKKHLDGQALKWAMTLQEVVVEFIEDGGDLELTVELDKPVTYLEVLMPVMMGGPAAMTKIIEEKGISIDINNG